VLVILVENLGFNTFSCNDSETDDVRSGLQTFCAESVRFTHAYTPSTLSQATVASLLSARYPQDHHVWNNGSSYLSPGFETVSEVGLHHGFRTSFFSGGPPVWRKAGINQGFEVFDESVQPSLRRLYRPELENIRLFLSWRDSEASHSPFLSFLFFPDLQFVDSPTINDLGEVRESSFHSQVEELDESLATLVKEMKQRKIWDSTTIILAGTNGYSPDSRAGELPASNLFSEITHIALLIKPARKNHESPFNWKVDPNVSLVDVGATIFDLIGSPIPSGKISQLPVISLKGLLRDQEPELHWNPERMVLSESGWTHWRQMGEERRFALRNGPLLFFYDQPEKVFNTLADNLEINPVPFFDPRFRQARTEFDSYFRELQYAQWTPPERRMIERANLGRELWRMHALKPEVLISLRLLSRKYPDDQQLRGWRAIWALRRESWSELKEIAAKPTQPIWQYIAERNQGKHPPLQIEDRCFAAFANMAKGGNPPSLRECGSPMLLDLFTAMDERQLPAAKQKAMDGFIRAYLPQLVQERVAQLNYVAGLTWDISIDQPGGPSLVDEILTLPENHKYKLMIQKRVQDASQ
jgi:hypothetical protein